MNREKIQLKEAELDAIADFRAQFDESATHPPSDQELLDYAARFRRCVRAGFGEDKHISATIFRDWKSDGDDPIFVEFHLDAPDSRDRLCFCTVERYYEEGEPEFPEPPVPWFQFPRIDSVLRTIRRYGDMGALDWDSVPPDLDADWLREKNAAGADWETCGYWTYLSHPFHIVPEIAWTEKADNPGTYLLIDRPNERRYWSKLAAMTDADWLAATLYLAHQKSQ